MSGLDLSPIKSQPLSGSPAAQRRSQTRTVARESSVLSQGRSATTCKRASIIVLAPK